MTILFFFSQNAKVTTNSQKIALFAVFVMWQATFSIYLFLNFLTNLLIEVFAILLYLFILIAVFLYFQTAGL